MLTACEFDQGLGPLQTGIRGSIFYLAPELRPARVDEVRVAALLKFPPSGLGDVFFSTPIAFKQDTVRYEHFLPPGEYPAVVLLWRAKGENWSFSSLLGVHGFQPPLQFELRPVSIAEGAPLVENVDIFALWNFANTDGVISGEISYLGDFPRNTEALLLAAFTREPDFDNLLASLLFLGGLPLPVSGTEPTYEYRLRVFHGTYQFIGLFWKGLDVPIEEMKLIGFFPDPAASTQPGTITVPENESVSEVDFMADFNSLPDGIRPGALPGRGTAVHSRRNENNF